MRAHEVIRSRRIGLGLSDLGVATCCGINIHQYGDVEQHADEFMSALTLVEARKLCECLDLNILQLVELETGTIIPLQSANEPEAIMPRNFTISTRRCALGISQAHLAEKLGLYDEIIDRIEREPQYIDQWSIDLVMALSNAL